MFQACGFILPGKFNRDALTNFANTCDVTSGKPAGFKKKQMFFKDWNWCHAGSGHSIPTRDQVGLPFLFNLLAQVMSEASSRIYLGMEMDVRKHSSDAIDSNWSLYCPF
jgi:hypothetical protein